MDRKTKNFYDLERYQIHLASDHPKNREKFIVWCEFFAGNVIDPAIWKKAPVSTIGRRLRTAFGLNWLIWTPTTRVSKSLVLSPVSVYRGRKNNVWFGTIPIYLRCISKKSLVCVYFLLATSTRSIFLLTKKQH